MSSSLTSNSGPHYQAIALLESRVLFVLALLALIAISIFNPLHVETNDKVKLAPQLELMLRLGATALGGLVGMYGILFIPKVQRAFLTFPLAWVVGIWFLYITSTVFSPYRSIAFPTLVTFSSVVLFAPTALAVLGARNFILCVLGCLCFTLASSWLLYLGLPEYGVMIEITDASGEYVERMGGTSHPNALAGSSVFALIITIYLFSESKISWQIALAAAILSLSTLAMTGTRVAIAAGALAIIVIYRDLFFRRDFFALTCLASLAAMVLLLLLVSGTFGNTSSILQSLTRSGDLDEITSVTGRAEIWEFVVKKIGERPIAGWGPGTAKTLLEPKFYLLHTHNVVLNMALIGGVVGGFFAIMMFSQQLFISLSKCNALAAMISIVVIINSLTENPIFGNIPGPHTVLWIAALGWPTLADDSL